LVGSPWDRLRGIIGKYEKDPEQRLAIPIVGHSYFKKTRFDYYISEIYEECRTNRDVSSPQCVEYGQKVLVGIMEK